MIPKHLWKASSLYFPLATGLLPKVYVIAILRSWLSFFFRITDLFYCICFSLCVLPSKFFRGRFGWSFSHPLILSLAIGQGPFSGASQRLKGLPLSCSGSQFNVHLYQPCTNSYVNSQWREYSVF